jgi:hypothetical protein
MYSEGNITAEKVYIIRDQGQTHLIYDGTVYETIEDLKWHDLCH